MRDQNPVIWFEIYVDDMKRAQKFYEEMLNVKLSAMASPTEDEMQMMTFPNNMESQNAASGALVKMEGNNAGTGGTIVYFYSDDCSIEENRIEKAGGKVLKPKTPIGQHGFITLGMDTENNTFGLHSMK